MTKELAIKKIQEKNKTKFDMGYIIGMFDPKNTFSIYSDSLPKEDVRKVFIKTLNNQTLETLKSKFNYLKD